MDDQITRIFLSFFLSLGIVFVTALIIGEERKAKWFKKRDMSKSIFNRRGMLGERCHFGHPRTLEGYAVVFVMYGIIITMSYFLIFKW